MHGLIWYQRSNSKIIRSCIVIFALFVLFGLPIWTIFEFIKFYQTIQIKTVTEASRGNVFRYPNLTVCHSRYFDNQLLKGLFFFCFSTKCVITVKLLVKLSHSWNNQLQNIPKYERNYFLSLLFTLDLFIF